MKILNVNRNPYFKNPKNSTVYTPGYVADYIYSIINPIIRPKVILDPSIGKGSLVQGWKDDCHIVGIDIDPASERYTDEFLCSKIEDVDVYNMTKPDLIVCNPPFNGASGRKLYPEVFLRKFVEWFGINIPIVLFAPMGFRLNQKKSSKRLRWLKNIGLKITSIISLPLDVFDGVAVHSEILIFNIPKIEAHYWVEEINKAA